MGCARARAHTHTHTHTHTHARTHSRTHARTHARTHTDTHTHNSMGGNGKIKQDEQIHERKKTKQPQKNRLSTIENALPKKAIKKQFAHLKEMNCKYIDDKQLK